MSTAKSLDALRREIDRIDNQIHDLIRQRTEVVEAVRDLKQGDPVKIRPAREDQILYRLVASHTGSFPKRELTRIWRELIVATLSFEGPFSVAVYETEGKSGCRDLARDMYGTYTPITAYASALRVVEAVRDQVATVGVLPLPRRGDPDPWWLPLVNEGAQTPRIIARLPFAGPSNVRDEAAEGYAICPVLREPTGRDRSLLGIETKAETVESRIAAALIAADLNPQFVTSWSDPGARGPWFYLAEVDGFVAPKDRRIERFVDALDVLVSGVVGLGSYGIPISADELDGPSAAESHRKPGTPVRPSNDSSRKS